MDGGTGETWIEPEEGVVAALGVRPKQVAEIKALFRDVKMTDLEDLARRRCNAKMQPRSGITRRNIFVLRLPATGTTDLNSSVILPELFLRNSRPRAGALANQFARDPILVSESHRTQKIP